MTKSKDKDGYLIVNLNKNNKCYKKKIHRLVAEVFISNPENKPQVNHIDENKQNNCYLNLEWVTNKENSNHGTKTERTTKALSEPIYGVNVDNGYIAEFQSAKYTYRNFGFSSSVIYSRFKENSKKPYKKYIWYKF